MKPDASHITRPSVEGQCAAMAAALRTARKAPHDVDAINAHGTGTQINDRVEGRILERMFGKRPWVNSTKSILGHTIGASGALEFVVAVLSLQHQAVHPCLNLEDPIVDLNFTLQGGAVPIQTVLTHSFGFGGHNAALVLGRVEPV